MFKIKSSLTSDHFSGSTPSIFVGRHGWPKVNVGYLSPPEVKENTWEYDAPRHWAKENYPQQNIISLRGSLVNSRFKSSIWVNQSRDLQNAQEVGMASKPVDMDIDLKKRPTFRVQYNPDIMPMGPNAELERATITSNPHITRKVEKVTSDTDLKANDALEYLYKSEYDENFLSKLLSAGTIGIKKRRTLVPTRWSITAVDDNIGKRLIAEIKDFNESNFLAYYGGFLGNYYLILFLPDIWSYELFEGYLPKASWNQTSRFEYMTDYEGYSGRKEYAFNTTGGYYAARLPILEELKSLKRQASVIAVRIITKEYEVPLGVWVVREAVRKTLLNVPIEFSSLELLLKYSKLIISKKLGVDLDEIIKRSVILKYFNEQKKLSQFI